MFSQADAYERFMGRWSRLLAPALVAFAEVRDGDAVLDAGCGTGSLSFAVRDGTGAARVSAVDSSAEYVGHAKTANHDPRVEFRVEDAQELPFPDGTFEKTLSLLVLNFIPDPARAVKEWLRVTKTGGVVSAAVWDYGEGMQMLRAFWDEAIAFDPAARPRDEAHMPLCRGGELSALWRQVGLQHVEEVALGVAQRFESFDEYWAPFLLGQGPAGAWVATLDAARRMELGERLRRRLRPPIELEARAWAVRGRVP
ncbi:MAG: methyltransferase domain-containing protein [Polyangiaceae bacterium]|nr:methyltransferase domain-containing protein [Polyangiaceae bacterium]MCL4751565.1 methyltransferase domain-containing protein [Myxococcales bacterium]